MAVVAVSALAGCTSEPPTRTPAQPSYQCCDASDLETPYQVGQIMTVRWKVVPADPQPAGNRSKPSEVRLLAHLTGPYETEAAVKAAAHKDQSGEATYTAGEVRPAGLVDEVPLSVIFIKLDAKPGYYNLVTAVGHKGGKASSAHIVRVVANPLLGRPPRGERPSRVTR